MLKYPLLALVIFAGSFLTSYSQTEKGSFLLGGNLSLGTSKSSAINPSQYGVTSSNYYVSQFSLTINPNISYFVIDRLAVGIVTPLVYTQEKGVNQGTNYYHSHSYNVGPMIRYYFLLEEKWALFAQADYTRGWEKALFGYSSKIGTLDGGAGLTYFLTKNIGLEGIMSYKNARYIYSTQGVVNTKVIAFNFNVGVQVYLNRK